MNGMKLIKSEPIAALDPNNSQIISITASMQYIIDNTGSVEPKPDGVELVREAVYYENIPYKSYFQPSLLKRDMDIYAWKNKTDIVVQGTVRSDSPRKNIPVSLSCRGKDVEFSFDIIVMGDRWVEKGKAGFEFSDPELFTEMPVRYDKAYGGTDEIAERKNTEADVLELYREVLADEDREYSNYSYPRNPAGKGFIVDPVGLNGLELPNLELDKPRIKPENIVRPLREWGTQPYPACFDWFQHGWFPRSSYLGDLDPIEDRTVPGN